MKKIILGAALAFVSLSLTSCLHDNEELFDKPAAERMQEAIKADKELLESASNGWQMRYYTGEQYTGGGYTMFMKFKSGKAYVASDLATADMVTSSSYDVITDRGPVLTFNTYNTIMHYLAQPYQSDVDGEQGDYEFIITKTTQDSIFVKGKKWGNKFVMTRVPENVSWKETIEKMQSVKNSMRFAYLPEGATSTNDAVLFDPTLRRVYTNGDTSTGVPYFYDVDGVGFEEPVTIAGKEVTSLKYDEQTMNFSSADGSLQLNNYTPEGFKPIDEYYGSWNMSYDGYDSQTGTYTPLTQTFSFQPMADTFGNKSQTALLGQFSIGSYNFATQFTYSPISGYMYLQSYIFQSPLSSVPYMTIMPAYTELNEEDGKTYYRLANGYVNFVSNGDGSCQVTFDDPKATMILLVGVTSSMEIYGIMYAWENPSDFVSTVSGAKKLNPDKLYLRKNFKLN